MSSQPKLNKEQKLLLILLPFIMIGILMIGFIMYNLTLDAIYEPLNDYPIEQIQ